MKIHRRRALAIMAQIVAFVVPSVVATAQDIRIVAYNIDDDVTGSSGFNPNLNAGTDTVLEGIDNYTGPFSSPATSGSLPAQTIDILALEETSFNTTTHVDSSAASVVSDLNAYATSIGSNAVYATPAIPAAAQTTGIGNGPNAIVYNTKTMTLVGTPVAITGSGIARPVMRYEFNPVGAATYQNFYIYVTHAKSSGSDSGSALVTDETRRNTEMQAIRTNAGTLGAASVLYMGDFNMSGTTTTGVNSEPGYQTITQTTASGASSVNAGVDPANPTNDYTETWDTNATYKSILSESAKDLRYRDDMQLMTSGIYNGTGPVLRYVGNSQVPYGNNGTAGVFGNVTNSTGTGISAAVLSALTTASDHLPVVSDYTLASTLGDVNSDGLVNFTDLNIVLNNLGMTSSLRSQGNFDGAATIDLTDLDDVLNNLGVNYATSGAIVDSASLAATSVAAPEPASLAILLPLGLLLSRRRPTTRD